jgi:hypothetical protein
MLEYNVYCDESCHLENDNQKAMVLGAIWCQKEKVYEISSRLKEIREKHGFSHNFEIKWTKVSKSKVDFYLDIIDYFFDDDDLYFRAVIVPDKKLLDHNRFNQDHDDFYYKMFFYVLKNILRPQERFNIYIDIKDTLGNYRVENLKRMLSYSQYDFSNQIINQFKRVHSHEVILLQLADLIIGALSYVHRGLSDNEGKNIIIQRIKERSRYSLDQSTLNREPKLNLFIWKAQ